MSARELISERLDLWTGAVTKKSSSGRGSNGKIELTGIKKLRELILQLAVMGRLVEQDVADTSPNLQVDKIYIERTGLIAAGKIRPPSRRPTLSAPELKPFSIPDSWSWTKLEDLFAVVTDGDHQAPPKSEKGVPFLVIGNLNAGQINFFGCKHVDEAYYEKLDWGRKPTSGDLLYTVTGSYGIPIKVETERAFCVQRHVAILRATDSTPGDFVKLLLASTFGKAYADSIATGIAQKTVPLTGLRKMPVPLPPVQEQHRIVQKVDELMALCDRLEKQTSDQLEAHETLVDTLLGSLLRNAEGSLTQSENATELADNWARLAAHFDTLFTTEQSIDKLKQTILQLAVMGRLVEQDAGDEPTEGVVSKIDQEITSLVKQGQIKKPKPTPEISDSDKFFEIPASWQWVRLGSLALHSEAGWSPKCHDAPRENQGWAVLKVSAVTWGEFRPGENKELPSNLTPRPEYEVHPSDFLISRANTSELVARSVVVPKGAPTKLMMSDKIIRFVFSDQIEPLYINLFNNSPFARSYYLSVAGGTSRSMKNVSRAQIQALAVPLPPRAEQTRIVQKVDELMALCDQLKERLNQASETRCQLAGAIVEQGLSV